MWNTEKTTPRQARHTRFVWIVRSKALLSAIRALARYLAEALADEPESEENSDGDGLQRNAIAPWNVPLR